MEPKNSTPNRPNDSDSQSKWIEEDLRESCIGKLLQIESAFKVYVDPFKQTAPWLVANPLHNRANTRPD